ncbi:MAG: Hsp70 family protein, partial [Candidatus Lokiarchaeota archaeon]|nr:Hsp70 family protein [Candidatus Lokiarchaeota archaeon]
MSMKEIIGIDFGTTNSKMAFLELNEPKIIKNKEGYVNTPSVVYFKNEKEIIIGEQAKKNVIPFPDRTITSIKRQMGTKFKFKVDGKKYPPEFIGGLIFQKLITDAKSKTLHDFNDAIITVPANYTDGQRQAIKDAADISGLNIIRIINEPTAAALAYGIKETSDKCFLIYDFGGGTLDITLLTVSGGFFNVEASTGINKLGGDNIDNRLSNFIIKKIKRTRKIDATKDLSLLSRIKEISEETKIRLSKEDSVLIDIPFIGTDSKKRPINFEYELDREQFNEMIEGIIKKTKQPIKNVFETSGFEFEDIDDVILVGGTTKIPAVQTFIEDFLNKKPIADVDPFKIVALGAAIASSMHKDIKIKSKLKDIEISDVLPHSYGIYT